MSDSFDLKFHHGALSVPDLAASVDWFRTMLGFEVEKYFKVPVPANAAMLKRGPMRIELFEVPDAHPLPPERREPHDDLHTHGNKHIAFCVRDVKAVTEELRRKGADIAMYREFEFGAFAFIRDNGGNLIEIVEEPGLWVDSAEKQP